jgi:hypothetical protein
MGGSLNVKLMLALVMRKKETLRKCHGAQSGDLAKIDGLPSLWFGI